MKKLMIRLLCCLVPSQKLRHKIREKFTKKVFTIKFDQDRFFWDVSNAHFHNTARLIATAELHKQTFAGFRNKFAGKTIVLVGAGPSLNKRSRIERLGMNPCRLWKVW